MYYRRFCRKTQVFYQYIVLKSTLIYNLYIIWGIFRYLPDLEKVEKIVHNIPVKEVAILFRGW